MATIFSRPPCVLRLDTNIDKISFRKLDNNFQWLSLHIPEPICCVSIAFADVPVLTCWFRAYFWWSGPSLKMTELISRDLVPLSGLKCIYVGSKKRYYVEYKDALYDAKTCYVFSFWYFLVFYLSVTSRSLPRMQLQYLCYLCIKLLASAVYIFLIYIVNVWQAEPVAVHFTDWYMSRRVPMRYLSI